MVLNLSKVLQQKADVLQDLRERTKVYLSKHGYTQKAMASAISISETYLNDFLNGRRGISPIPFTKIEQVLSLNAQQRKLQFYCGGNSGARACHLQAKGKKKKGQISYLKSYGDEIEENLTKTEWKFRYD